MRAKVSYVRARGTATEDLTQRITRSAATAWLEGEIDLEVGHHMVVSGPCGPLIRTSGVLEIRLLDDGDFEVHTFRSVYRVRYVKGTP